MTKLDERLAALATMSPAQLRDEWRQLYKSEPARLSPDLLRMGCAYRLQEKAQGALSKRVIRSLHRPSPAPSIKPGTRLVRSWNGRTIDVVVDEAGYVFEDERYASLSAIARKVTGAVWSGPRFFGIDRHD